MSSHLTVFAVGLALGAGITYLVTALHQYRYRANKPAVAKALHRQPLQIVRLDDITPNQDTLFRPGGVISNPTPSRVWLGGIYTDSRAE